MMPIGDPRGQIFLSHPYTHDGFLYSILARFRFCLSIYEPAHEILVLIVLLINEGSGKYGHNHSFT